MAVDRVYMNALYPGALRRRARPPSSRARSSDADGPARAAVRAALSEYRRSRSQREQLQRLKKAGRVAGQDAALHLQAAARRAVARAPGRGPGLMATIDGDRRGHAGSASARARAAWARRRPRRRSPPGSPRAGRRSCVLTIDPAKRLADSLGPRGAREHAQAGRSEALRARRRRDEGRALGDDARRQGDLRRARPQARTGCRDAATGSSRTASIASSPTPWPAPRSTWRWRSSSRSTRRARYDFLVLDTPPSRNALDFLDAPKRLTQFIEGRGMQMFMKPTGFATRVVGRGSSMAFGVLKRVTGLDLISDLSEFFQAFSGMVDGFRERAKRVSELLADPATTFVVVCGPQGEPIDEAVYFHRKLVEAKLPGRRRDRQQGPLRGRRGRRRARRETDLQRPARRRARRARRRRTSPTTRRWPSATPRNVEHLQRELKPKRGDPRPLPGRGRPRPRGPAQDRPLPVRYRGAARGAGGLRGA